MESTHRKWLYHNTPKWVDEENAIYFITICLSSRNSDELIKPDTAEQLLQSLSYYHHNRILFIHQALIMSDHIHLLTRIAPNGSSLKNAIAAWKSWTRKKLNIEWQQGFFEHRIRSEQELDLKYEYIALNPVRAGLVERAEDWPWKLEAFLG